MRVTANPFGQGGLAIEMELPPSRVDGSNTEASARIAACHFVDRGAFRATPSLMTGTRETMISCAQHGVILLALLSCHAALGTESNWPLLFDTTSATSVSVTHPYSPAPNAGAWPHTQLVYHPEGHGESPEHSVSMRALYDRLQREERPTNVLLNGPNTFPTIDPGDNPNLICPEGRRCYPNAIQETLDTLSADQVSLNYVFTDYEAFSADFSSGNALNAEPLLHEVTRLVRTHPSNSVNGAKIGSYDLYPATATPWWETSGDLAPTHHERFGGAYDRLSKRPDGSAGFNVAMPSLYPYELYALHNTPTHEAALFYGPLAKLTHIRQTLDTVTNDQGNLAYEGHQLIPFLGDYVVNTDLPGVVPPDYEALRANNRALSQHIRLRGADGFVSYGATLLRASCSGGNASADFDASICSRPDLQAEEGGFSVARADTAFTEYMTEAWSELDGFYNQTGGAFLHLSNEDKQSGVFWSAGLKDRSAAMVVSNLSGRILNFSQLPDNDVKQILIARFGFSGNEIFHDGTHQLFITPDIRSPGDFNHDGKVDAADYTAWRDSGTGSLSEFVEWRTHYGSSTNPAAVPEPNLCGAAAISLGCIGSKVRPRRRWTRPSCK